jgi:hypothetical protein
MRSEQMLGIWCVQFDVGSYEIVCVCRSEVGSPNVFLIDGRRQKRTVLKPLSI